MYYYCILKEKNRAKTPNRHDWIRWFPGDTKQEAIDRLIKEGSLEEDIVKVVEIPFNDIADRVYLFPSVKQYGSGWLIYE